ncbi:MAG: YafY family transcriptional regulator [Anaerolineae bacterium]|nr:YafY family transcriptional regulator [Anaerolineae bacterium]
MRADRLLRMLLLLHAQEHMTAHQLAATLEVSERTIYRDIDALSIAGIPIYTQPGTNGGVFLDADYRVSLTGLSRQELVALFVASGAGPLNDLSLGSAAEQSLLKLLAALPTIHRDYIKRLRQRVYIDPANWFQVIETLPLLGKLQQAVWDDRVIVLVYQRSNGEYVDCTVEPYALVAKANIWYLVARKTDGDMRTYRVARMQQFEVTEQRFVRTADFDLETFWQVACQTYETEMVARYTPYPATVVVDPDSVWYFEQFFAGYYEVLTVDEWVRLRVTFMSFDDAIRHVLGLNTHIRVEEPRALHEKVLATAQAILNWHQPPEA